MPYIYGLAEENSRDGLPLMRPVFLEFPQVLAKGDRLGETEDQFMLGSDLLIAPAVTGESPAPYHIALPSEGWFDYWTGQKVGSDVLETPQLDRLPVFVRPGSIIPKQPLIQSTMQTPSGSLQIHVYPGPSCTGTLYLDDGASFAYKTGDFLKQSLSCEERSDGLVITWDARTGRHRPWWTGFDVTIHGWSRPATAEIDGHPVPVHLDSSGQTLSFHLPDMSHLTSLRIRTSSDN